jgi:hypothetical protein
MNSENINKSPFRLEQFFGIALLISLYFMYSSTFLSDYLMNDEWINIGMTRIDIGQEVVSNFFRFGRGLLGIYIPFIYGFVSYDPARVQFIRFINFALVASIAFLLFRFLERRKISGGFAFFIMLFWLSQPSFQGLMGYSLQSISVSQPSIWLSGLAFYLYFFVFERRRLPKVLEWAIVFVLLTLAMQSTQVFAFFATIPVSFLALTDWKNRKNRVISFLMIAFAVLIFSTITYKIGLDFMHTQGGSGYPPGEEGVGALITNPINVILTALNPLAYWSVFKIWTFPYPLQNIPPLRQPTELAISILVMVAWLAIIFSSIFIERRGSPKEAGRNVLSKWFAVLLCLGLNAVFLIADSPEKIIEHRPHILLTLSGLVVFSGGYALQVLASKYAFLQDKLVRSLAGIVVVAIAFGAQSGVLRNMVDNNMRQMDFMRSELMGAGPLTDYNDIIVVLPRWNGCVAEPCGAWMGKIMEGPLHISEPAAYRYALSTLGVSPAGKNITFVQQKPNIIPDNTIVIDWNKYASVYKSSFNYFNRSQN